MFLKVPSDECFEIGHQNAFTESSMPNFYQISFEQLTLCRFKKRKEFCRHEFLNIHSLSPNWAEYRILELTYTLIQDHKIH